ncbi:MAG: sensor histidine kinase [Gemmatimonadales bacterium]
MSARAPSSAPLGLRVRLGILAAWTALGLLETVKGVVALRLRGVPVPVDHQVVASMPWWYMWAALTPPAIALARRVRLDIPRWPLAGAVHFGASVVFTAVHIAVVGALFYYTITRGQYVETLTEQYRNWVATFTVLDILTYWAIVGAFYAFDYRRGLRERDLAAAQLAVRAAQAEARTREAQLTALQAELNPHFLFNSLNAVAALIRRDDRDQALGVLAGLGDLLRATLSRGEHREIPLKLELGHVRRYLEIERTRFSDRLRVEEEVAAELLDAMVPTLLLQPLVENAVRHGVARTPGPGRVMISAEHVNGDLHIMIEDSGPGFPAGDAAVPEGVGLRNTRERLYELFGGRARLVAANRREGGAVVRVVLPYRTHANRDD